MIGFDVQAESKIDAASQAIARMTRDFSNIDLAGVEVEVRPLNITGSARILGDRYEVRVRMPHEIPARFTYEEIMNF